MRSLISSASVKKKKQAHGVQLPGLIAKCGLQEIKRKTCVLFKSVKKKLTWARRLIHLPRTESMEKLYASARVCYQPDLTSNARACY